MFAADILFVVLVWLWVIGAWTACSFVSSAIQLEQSKPLEPSSEQQDNVVVLFLAVFWPAVMTAAALMWVVKFLTRGKYQ